MTDSRTKVLLDNLAFPEGPRWHAGKLWFSDQHDGWIHTLDTAGIHEKVLAVPAQPSGLGWDPDGHLLIASMLDRKLLRYDGDTLREEADLRQLAPHHCNDMVVDARGRAYIGNFGSDIEGGEIPIAVPLILVEPGRPARTVGKDLQFPNGCVIRPDGRSLIVAETYGARLSEFDIEDDGNLSNHRIFATLEGAVPDGICLDAEDCIWAASPISQEVLRIRAGGEVTQRIAVENQAYACMLGGDDRKTLFICTAETHLSSVTLAKRTGRIEAAQVEVPGVGLP